MDRERERRAMVELVTACGVQDPSVLSAMLDVPRHLFVPGDVAEFAYADTALPIEEREILPRPCIVATMAEALWLEPVDRVLEIGTGSGYFAAVLSRIAREVVTLARHASLAESTRRTLCELGYDNVKVVVGDESKGWPDLAPYDAIVTATPRASVPQVLLDQLRDDGRLVLPVGGRRTQTLRRIVRERGRFYRQDLGDVRFVPLIGREAWPKEEEKESWTERLAHRDAVGGDLPRVVAEVAEPFDHPDDVDLRGLLARAGDARLVLLGESTGGTSEFYRMRARITEELVLRAGFDTVVFDADWSDVERIDCHVRGAEPPVEHDGAQAPRFRTSVLLALELEELIGWLRAYNLESKPKRPVALYGLDLYSMHRSIRTVLDFLEGADPELGAQARRRYDHITPWQHDPGAYGASSLGDAYRDHEVEVLAVLRGMLDQRLAEGVTGDDRFFEALQSAQVLAGAERYYRALYYGAPDAWSLRDRHMFETLRALMSIRGAGSKFVVWAHNSHVGDALATELGARGEINLGRLCRSELEEPAYIVGFSTDHGSVLAASTWDGPQQVMELKPSHPESYEHVMHECRFHGFFLPMRAMTNALRDKLREPRVERMIGRVYRPETELESHYVSASLPLQFDELVYIDRTRALRVAAGRQRRVWETYAPALPRSEPRSAPERGDLEKKIDGRPLRPRHGS